MSKENDKVKKAIEAGREPVESFASRGRSDANERFNVEKAKLVAEGHDPDLAELFRETCIQFYAYGMQWGIREGVETATKAMRDAFNTI